MTIAAFLTELADKLERGPANVAEYKTWARDCRDYATVAHLTEHLAAPKPTPGLPAPLPIPAKRGVPPKKTRKVATT